MNWWKISALLLLLYVLTPGQILAGAGTVEQFLILYSNNVHGEIEPCG